MSEGADGDTVDAGEGDGADGFEGDTAGGFQGEFGFFVGSISQIDGHFHARAVHVVEEYGVDAIDFEDFAELLEVVDFDLDKPLRGFSAAGVNDWLKFCGEFAQRVGGQMVVFDEQAVIQAHAVVMPPTGEDGVFVEEAQTGHGFAGVEDLSGGALDAADKFLREGGDAAHALEKIQDHALGGEERARWVRAGEAAEFRGRR